MCQSNTSQVSEKIVRGKIGSVPPDSERFTTAVSWHTPEEEEERFMPVVCTKCSAVQNWRMPTECAGLFQLRMHYFACINTLKETTIK